MAGIHGNPRHASKIDCPCAATLRSKTVKEPNSCRADRMSFDGSDGRLSSATAAAASPSPFPAGTRRTVPLGRARRRRGRHRGRASVACWSDHRKSLRDLRSESARPARPAVPRARGARPLGRRPAVSKPRGCPSLLRCLLHVCRLYVALLLLTTAPVAAAVIHPGNLVAGMHKACSC
jgi:hypothetical protein